MEGHGLCQSQEAGQCQHQQHVHSGDKVTFVESVSVDAFYGILPVPCCRRVVGFILVEKGKELLYPLHMGNLLTYFTKVPFTRLRSFNQ